MAEETGSSGSHGCSLYQKHVLEELRALKSEVCEGRKEIGQLKIDLAILKTKSSLWGAAGGLLAAIGAYLLRLI